MTSTNCRLVKSPSPHNVLIAKQVYGDVASRVKFDKGMQERLDLYNLMYRGMFYFKASAGSCLIQ